MKSIFESDKTLQAYAEIDMCYYRLSEINTMIQRQHPKTPIDIMIDRATKRDIKETIELEQEITDLMKGIIKNKKYLNADYSRDVEFLEKVKDLKQKNPQDNK